MKRFLRRFADKQNHSLDTPEVPVRIPHLPQGLEGTRLLLLSDLHFHHLQPFHEDIVNAARRLAPHCILLTGDCVDAGTERFDSLRLFFGALSSAAPCAAVLGNNDCADGKTPLLREVFRRSGVCLLENENRQLFRNGCRLNLMGITDPLAIEKGVSRARKNGEKGCVSREKVMTDREAGGQRPVTVLLLHRPELAKNFLTPPPELIVSGHAHGGQFRLPGGQGLYAPGQGIFPRLTSGLYRTENTYLYVSRGVGNHGFPLRLNNPPHLPLLILKKGESGV